MKQTILFINGHLNPGGCERSLVDLINTIDKTKYDVHLLLLEEKGDYLDELSKDVSVYLYSLNNAFGSFVQVIKNAITKLDFFSIIFRLIYFFATKTKPENLKFARFLFRKLNHQYDSIIAYRPGICTDFAAYVFKSNNKISWWHHGDISVSASTIDKIDHSYKYMNTIVSVSQGCKALIQNHFSNSKDKIVVIPNMVSILGIEEKSKSLNPFENTSELKIVSVGRLSPEKNFSLCPKIASLLNEKGISYRWFIIGDGEEYNQIQTLIKSYNLDKSIIMTGMLNNPYPYIKNADILVHPSVTESQGITLIEAMALRTPVISVSSSGPTEFIQSLSNGILTNNSEREIADNIITLANNESLKATITEKGYITAQNYSPETIVDSVYAIIERIN